MARPWNISLLGGLTVRGGDRTTTHFRSHRCAALLGLLAYRTGRPQPRELVADLLWPDLDTGSGRRNLRVELSSLRQLFEAPGLPSPVRSDRNAVWLDAHLVDIDFVAFEHALTLAGIGSCAERLSSLRAAVAAYSGDLLPGLYDDWVVAERQRLADACVGALRQLATLLEEDGCCDEAIDTAHRILAFDTANEEAHLRLVRLFSSAGRRSVAAHQYGRMVAALRDELGCEPSGEAQELAARLGLDGAGGNAASDQPTRNGAAARLPGPLARFIGRAVELARIVESLRPGGAEPPERLVTLTGTGGIGKTRLSMEAATALLDEYGGGIWFVALADLRDPGEVLAAIASSVGRADLAGSPMDRIAAAIGSRPALLILDNLEQLVDDRLPVSAAEVVASLLERLANVSVLATSRRRLGIPGEIELVVPPLPVPGPNELSRVDGAACESVELFADRMRRAHGGVAWTAGCVRAVESICARLDGLPLALELAASWARTLTPQEILEKIEAGAELLVGRDAARPGRHRTLAAALTWSIEILPEDVRDAFARLSVFRGSFDLDAAQAVCELADPLARVAALQDNSLLVAEECGARMRYRMLEPIREFAAGLLAPEARPLLLQRHAALYADRTEAAARALRSGRRAEATAALTADLPNIAAAVERAAHHPDGLRIAAAAAGYCAARGMLETARAWLDRTLGANASSSSVLHARALLASAMLAALAGDASAASTHASEGFALLRGLTRDEDVSWALRQLANPKLLLRAAAHFDEALIDTAYLAERIGDPPVRAFLLAYQARRMQFEGLYEQALAILQRCAELFGGVGDDEGMAAILQVRGTGSMLRGDLVDAERSWSSALEFYRLIGDPIGETEVLSSLAYIQFRRGDLPAASATAADVLQRSQRLALRTVVASTCWLQGAIHARSGEYGHARDALERAIDAYRDAGVKADSSDVLMTLGQVELCTGNTSAARSRLEKALASRRQGPDRHDVAMSVHALGEVALLEGDLEEAGERFSDTLAIAEELGNAALKGWAHLGLGLVELRRGEQCRAERHLCAGAACAPLDQPMLLAPLLEAMAEMNGAMRRWRRAAMALAVAQVLREEHGLRLPPAFAPRLAALRRGMETALGSDEVAQTFNRAAASQLEEALADALRSERATSPTWREALLPVD